MLQLVIIYPKDALLIHCLRLLVFHLGSVTQSFTHLKVGEGHMDYVHKHLSAVKALVGKLLVSPVFYF